MHTPLLLNRRARAKYKSRGFATLLLCMMLYKIYWQQYHIQVRKPKEMNLHISIHLDSYFLQYLISWNDTVISARNLLRISQSALTDLHTLKSSCKSHIKFRDHIAVSFHDITKILKYMKLLYFRRGKFFAYCQRKAVSL